MLFLHFFLCFQLAFFHNVSSPKNKYEFLVFPNPATRLAHHDPLLDFTINLRQ